jgi:hypothetical protein
MNVLSNAPSHPIPHRGQAQGAAACTTIRLRVRNKIRARAASLAQQHRTDIDAGGCGTIHNTIKAGKGPERSVRGRARSLVAGIQHDPQDDRLVGAITTASSTSVETAATAVHPNGGWCGGGDARVDDPTPQITLIKKCRSQSAYVEENLSR